MSRIVFAYPNKCVGCHQCEIACLLTKKHSHCQDLSHIRIEISWKDTLYYPTLCIHCEDPECEKVCPAWAIGRNGQTGAVIIDAERCIGCRMCILACPYGCIQFDPKEHRASKCDLCGGDPACMRVCASRALEFVERDEVSFRKVDQDFGWLRLLSKEKGI